MTGAPLCMRLSYTSPAKMAEYRDAPMAASPITTLTYDLVPAEDVLSSPRGAVQARFVGHSVFLPRFTFKGHVMVKAVIDRMMILLVTRDTTSWSGIHGILEDDVGRFPFVSGREGHAGDLNGDGIIELPTEMKSAYGPGRVFAIVFQEPTPKKLSRALREIDGKYGIIGKVVPYLIELAVDFFPRAGLRPEHQTQIREEMVGLLQRHHGIRAPGFSTSESDARQVYVSPNPIDPNATKTDFLFSSPGNAPRKLQDHEVTHTHVVSRLVHGKSRNHLFLDATLYKGSVADGLLIRVQHKITDERNATAGTVRDLLIAERRARIEAEISGPQRLWDDLLLRDVNDLSTLNFRTIRKKYLEFWLSTASSAFSEQIMVRKQMEDRGLYGVEILKSLEKHLEKRRAKTRPKLADAITMRDRKGMGSTGELVAWTDCNERVGDALDALTASWKRFRW